MDYFQVALLAFIQGITEFLPISSSAHLILPSKIFGFNDQGLAFDVAVHFGGGERPRAVLIVLYL